MRHRQYSADAVVRVLRSRSIATMAELQGAMGTQSARTVFRRLKELECRTSYSHKGGFYALDEVVRFDGRGLWSYDNVRFSKYGTLLVTAEHFVETSQGGYFGDELDHVLEVATKDALRILCRRGRIARETLEGKWLYCSGRRDKRQLQLLFRQNIPGPAFSSDIVPDELKAAIVLFFSLLDERQKRLYAGLESLKVGRGGICTIAQLLGVAEDTVARGRQQLLERDVDVERVRRSGGGRAALEKKRQKSSKGSRS